MSDSNKSFMEKVRARSPIFVNCGLFFEEHLRVSERVKSGGLVPL